jgi:membrane-associated PAP2 superfamily phosphatase
VLTSTNAIVGVLARLFFSLSDLVPHVLWTCFFSPVVLSVLLGSHPLQEAAFPYYSLFSSLITLFLRSFGF